MKHVTDQRKRKRWLAPLALCLAVCLAMQPVGLNAVLAEENAEENAVSAFWAAADEFWGENGKQTAFQDALDALWWGNEDKKITGAMQVYNDARDNNGDMDAARKNIQDAIAACEAAYPEVEPAFDNVKAKYEALSDDEIDEGVQGVYDEICKIYNGDGTEDYMGVEVQYQNACVDIEIWNYWDNEFQYQEACGSFYAAQDALNGKYDEEGNLETPGAMTKYEEARDKGGDMDAAREAVLEAADGMKDAYALIDPFYQAMIESYKKLSELSEDAINAEEKQSIEGNYNETTENKENLDKGYEEFLNFINIWKYTSCNEGYGKARDLFWEATNKFEGNENVNITGALTTYTAALESEAEELGALYEEVLAAQAAVEEAYKTMTVKYNAASEAYETLTEAEKQAPPYNGADNTVADIHKNMVDDYTTGWVPETYNRIHECEIPAPIRYSKISAYISSNNDYWETFDPFWEAANNFAGNEQKNIVGAHPAYIAALESESEELDALYEKVLAARTAVEKAYETMTEKYQAANAAYAALNEAEQREPYGEEGTKVTVADIHKDIVDAYTIGQVPETYKMIHECEIPAPPQKEEPELPQTIEGILNFDYSEATKDKVNAAVDKLVEAVDKSETFDAADAAAMENVDKLETAYARENKITLADSEIADDVKDFGSDAAPKVVGALIALQPAAETTIKLAVKSTATQPAESLKNAVAVDIDLVDGNGQSLTKNAVLKFPVTITISVPTALKNATKIGIEHGDETIFPKMADGKLIFAVTHFSDFVFYDAGNTDTPGTDTPGSGNDVSGNDPGSTDTPGSGNDVSGNDPGSTDTPGSGNDVSGNDPGSTDTPGTDTPGTDTPGTDTPGTDTPGTDTPGTNTPGTDTPGTDTPGTDTPGTDTPGTDTPGTNTPGTTDTPGNSGTSNSPAPATDYYSNSMQSMEQAIAAAEKGSTVKIVTTESVTLTSSVLRTLINNPNVSLYLEYTYNGKDYKVLIPAGKAFVVEGIEYYGPLYLYSLFPYDGREVNENALEYTIAKGDTLTKIAKKNNTTVSELVKLNRIKNPNRIRAGQKIVLPAK